MPCAAAHRAMPQKGMAGPRLQGYLPARFAGAQVSPVCPHPPNSLDTAHFLRLAPWPSPPVPVLSPTNPFARVHPSASAASTTFGCVVEDVKTAIGAAVAVVGRCDMALPYVRVLIVQKVERKRMYLCAPTDPAHVFKVWYAFFLLSTCVFNTLLPSAMTLVRVTECPPLQTTLYSIKYLYARPVTR